AYLNALLNDEIYIKPPATIHIMTGKILRLCKSLYSLKQVVQCWSNTLVKVLGQ
ncbi:hypothetical protein L873DRAFT_1669719, partial [Choiromyces venosus 120613-1]